METLLIIAFVLFLALISMRYYEINKRNQTSFSKFLRKGDVHVEGFYAQVKKWSRSLNDLASNIKHGFIEKSWNSFTHSVHFTKKKVDTLHDRLNGKGEVKQSDHVSFYLQSVSDHKKSMRDNKN